MRKFLSPAFFVFMVLVIMMPGQILAVCSTGVGNDIEGPAFSVGNYANGVVVNVAQSFVLDCSAQVLQVGADFSFTDAVSLETQPLAIGDTIRCDILDDQGDGPIMTSYFVRETDVSSQHVVFDFSDNEFELAAAEYILMISIPQESWVHIRLGSEYADGERNSIVNGAWLVGEGDLSFTTLWDSESEFVPETTTSWDALKSYYR